MNMPYYMEAFIRDSLIRIQCPSSVRDFIESHESYSMSGNPCKGEEADFLLESKNKSSKRLLPPGLPSDTTWIRSCRNVDRFDRVRKGIEEVLGIAEENDSTYMYSISREISQFRKIIRDEDFLFAAKLEGLSGEKLDDELVEITTKSQNNLSIFIHNLKETKNVSNRPKLKKLIITSEDREHAISYSSKTKTELAELIDGRIRSNSALREKWKHVKRGRKEDYISFLTDLDHM